MKLSLRAKNFIAALASNFGVQGLRFFTMTLLARRLGLHLFGVYNYVLLLLTYGSQVVEFGLKNLGIRDIAQGRNSPKLVKQILKIRLGLAPLTVAVIMVLTHFAFPESSYQTASFFMGASLFVDAFLLDYVLIAHEALVPLAVSNLGQAGFLLAACLILVKGPDDFLWLTQFYILSHVVWIAILALEARKYLKNPSAPAEVTTPQSTWRTALAGSPFMIAILVSSIMASMDLLLLGQFHYENWLGPYSAALKILGIVLAFINSLLSAIQPKLAKHSHDLKSAKTLSLIDSTTRFLLLFVTPTVIGCWLFGDHIVMWVFGPAYAAAGPLLKPLSLAFGLLTLSMPPSHLIQVSHHTRQLLKIVIFNGLFSACAVGGVLILGKPEWVAWTMVLVEAMFLVSVWSWYGAWRVLTFADIKFLSLPVALLVIPLLVPFNPVFQFALAGCGFVAGLALMKFWKQPWFVTVLGRS